MKRLETALQSSSVDGDGCSGHVFSGIVRETIERDGERGEVWAVEVGRWILGASPTMEKPASSKALVTRVPKAAADTGDEGQCFLA